MTNSKTTHKNRLAKIERISRCNFFTRFIRRVTASITNKLNRQLGNAVPTNRLCGISGFFSLFVALQCGGQDTNIQATAGVISPPFSLKEGSIAQPLSTGVTNGGRAVYAFTVTNAGDYLVAASVNAPSSEANSFFVNIDANPIDPSMIWDIPVTQCFEKRSVSWRGNGTPGHDEIGPRRFPLSAGSHKLIIIGREANVQLKEICISISKPPSPPTNLRVVTAVAN